MQRITLRSTVVERGRKAIQRGIAEMLLDISPNVPTIIIALTVSQLKKTQKYQKKNIITTL